MPLSEFHGQDPIIELYKKNVDRTLISENLKLTVEERFRKAMALMRFALSREQVEFIVVGGAAAIAHGSAPSNTGSRHCL